MWSPDKQKSVKHSPFSNESSDKCKTSPQVSRENETQVEDNLAKKLARLNLTTPQHVSKKPEYYEFKTPRNVSGGEEPMLIGNRKRKNPILQSNITLPDCAVKSEDSTSNVGQSLRNKWAILQRLDLMNTEVNNPRSQKRRKLNPAMPGGSDFSTFGNSQAASTEPSISDSHSFSSGMSYRK